MVLRSKKKTVKGVQGMAMCVCVGGFSFKWSSNRGLSGKVTFACRPKGDKGMSHSLLGAVSANKALSESRPGL